MNKVILIGRLTKDPEMRTTSSGISVATFTLAVNRPFTDQSGERQADFINCVVWRKPAETLCKYVKKGQELAVEGSMQTRSYDHQDGSKRYVTEVICDRFDFIGGGNRNEQKTYDGPVPYEPNNNGGNIVSKPENTKPTDITEDPFKDFGSEISLSDDDLPF